MDLGIQLRSLRFGPQSLGRHSLREKPFTALDPFSEQKDFHHPSVNRHDFLSATIFWLLGVLNGLTPKCHLRWDQRFIPRCRPFFGGLDWFGCGFHRGAWKATPISPSNHRARTISPVRPGDSSGGHARGQVLGHLPARALRSINGLLVRRKAESGCIVSGVP